MWSRIMGESKFWGVHRQNGKWGTSYSREQFASEEEAAAECDKWLVQEKGTTAMTNAKYMSGPEAREWAWEERRQVLVKKHEDSMRGKSSGPDCPYQTRGHIHAFSALLRQKGLLVTVEDRPCNSSAPVLSAGCGLVACSCHFCLLSHRRVFSALLRPKVYHPCNLSAPVQIQSSPV